MATLDGYLAGGTIPIGNSPKGRFVTLSAYNANLGTNNPIIRYAMIATCTTSPTGYITWENNTGDSVNRPVCAGTGGLSKIVTSWIIQQ